MYRNYVKAAGALYGDDHSVPATTPLPIGRSNRHGQKKPVKRHTESAMQMHLATWLRNQGVSFFSIPNEGNRGRIATHRLKQMGLWPGASDLFIAHPASGHAGCFVELKSPGEKPRPNQVEFMQAMRGNGYRAEWFDSWEDARQSIADYLGRKEGPGHGR